MQKARTRIFCSIASAVLFVLTPSSTLADGVSTKSTASMPTVIITELQTGSATSGKDEFIELYNGGATNVDIANWQLRYVSAASTSANLTSPTQTITIAAASNTVIPAGGYFVLHTTTVALPQGAAGQTYSYTLPMSGGSIVLLQPNAADCTLTVEDAVAWGSGTFGQGTPIAASSKDADYQRFVAASGRYAETFNNANDFAVATPTPAAVNTQTTSNNGVITTTPTPTTIKDPTCTLAPGDDGSGSDQGSLQTPGDDDTPPEGDASGDSSDTDDAASKSHTPAIPSADFGLVTPQLTELLPNPAPPQTDANDEFIELYNANDGAFDLSGFKLVAGLTTQHTYTFPSGTTLAPHGFTAFFSADTGLSLSNSGGQVVLEDPNGNLLGQTMAYGTAKDGEAWALTRGTWAWTTTPTPNVPNVITVPRTASKTAAKVKKTAPSASGKRPTTKATAKTSSKPKARAAAASTVTASSLTADTSPTPIHASVLAFAALFALLYGAYEYRRDVANRLHQYRSYRGARRQARASAAGRRGG